MALTQVASAFPKIAKISLSRELDRLELGAVTIDFKPLEDRGKGIIGVYKTRTREQGDIFRIAYIAKCGEVW